MADSEIPDKWYEQDNDDPVFDLSDEQLWGLRNGKEIVLETAHDKIRIRGENYYEK